MYPGSDYSAARRHQMTTERSSALRTAPTWSRRSAGARQGGAQRLQALPADTSQRSFPHQPLWSGRRDIPAAQAASGPFFGRATVPSRSWRGFPRANTAAPSASTAEAMSWKRRAHAGNARVCLDRFRRERPRHSAGGRRERSVEPQRRRRHRRLVGGAAGTRAVMWSSGEMRDLGGLAGAKHSRARAINARARSSATRGTRIAAALSSGRAFVACRISTACFRPGRGLCCVGKRSPSTTKDTS